MTRRAAVYDLKQVRARLAEFVALHGWRVAAEKCGCTVSYLKHILHPILQKHPGPRVLAALDLERAYVSTEAHAAPEIGRCA